MVNAGALDRFALPVAFPVSRYFLTPLFDIPDYSRYTIKNSILEVVMVYSCPNPYLKG